MTTAMLLDNPSATAWAEKFSNSQETSTSKENAKEAVKLRAEALAEADADDRLTLLESPEWEFEEEHLRQVNTIVEAFIGATARQQLREMANQCLDQNENPVTIVQRRLTEERLETLGEMVNQTTVPDRLITFCYAWLEVYETAMAIHALETYRRMPPLDFENFEHTPEDREADRRFIERRFTNLR